MPTPPLLVTVQAVRGYLLIQGSDQKHPNWVPAGDGRFGCALLDSAQYLGVSPEALALLSAIPIGPSTIGDVDWFLSGEKHVFGWMGNPRKLVQAATARFARGSVIGPHAVISNELSAEVQAEVDAALAGTR